MSSSLGETNDDVDENSEKASSSETTTTTTTAIALATTIEKDGDAESETEYELVGPKPERFKVAEGQLAGLLTAVTPASTKINQWRLDARLESVAGKGTSAGWRVYVRVLRRAIPERNERHGIVQTSRKTAQIVRV